MIIGSLKKSKMSLFIGVSPEIAANNLSSLLKQGDNEDNLSKVSQFNLGGIRFLLFVSGSPADRVFALRGLDDPVKFLN